ncbi:precorrin-3B synthase [Pseudomonas sp. PDM14]|nr:precorrin-3B synthase [Pseudomonas sp. PDM14]
MPQYLSVRVLLVRSPRLASGDPLNELPAIADLPVPRPSACPGLLRIVAALDGGVCRVKLPCGVLSSAQARAIASAAQACASGVLELTNRSNLQVRGVRSDQADRLIAALLDAGLGPRTLGADDVRNLLVSPAAGLDPAAHLDVRPLAEQILDLLQDTPAFHGLSPKFALQLDGGEALNMLEHPHDLWLSAVPGDDAALAFGLAGRPLDAPLARVPREHAVALVEAVLQLFLDIASDEQVRMRQLLGSLAAEDFLVQLQARLPFALLPAQRVAREPVLTRLPLGLLPQRQTGLQMLLAASDLGRIDASQLTALADIAERDGDGSLRLTPWQGVLLPNIASDRAAAVRAAVAALRLRVDAEEPLTQLVACTGSAACIKGHADTKADALRLAELLRAGGARPQVHLSGCARSCSSAHTAPFTLLAQPGGRYQLYQRAPGVSGFGRLLAPSLSIDDAGAWFAAQSEPGKTA